MNHRRSTVLSLNSELTTSCLGYGFDAATELSIMSPSSASPSSVMNSTDPTAVYARTSISTPIAEKHWDVGARRQPHSVTASFLSALDDVVEKHNEGLCGLDEVLLPIKLGTWRGGFVFIFVYIVLGSECVLVLACFSLLILLLTFLF